MMIVTAATSLINSTVTDIQSIKKIILDIPRLLREIRGITKIKIPPTPIRIPATIVKDTTMKVISPMNLIAMTDTISPKRMNKSILRSQINRTFNKRIQNDHNQDMDLIRMLQEKQYLRSRHQWSRYLWINLTLKTSIRFRVLIFRTVKYINLIKRCRIPINLLDNNIHKKIKRYFLILTLMLPLMKSMRNRNMISKQWTKSFLIKTMKYLLESLKLLKI